MSKHFFGILLILLFLSGCASTDNSPKPAELTPFKQKFNLVTDWAAQTGYGANKQFINLTPAIVGDEVFTVDTYGLLEKRQRSTGELLFSVDLQQSVTAGIGVGEELLFIGTAKGDLLALSAKDGHIVWQKPQNSEILAKPSSQQGVVVVQTISGQVNALSASDGKALWSYHAVLPALTLRGSSSPLIIDDYALCGLANGKVVILNLETGEELWAFAAASPSGASEIQQLVDIDGSVLFDNETIFAVTYQGNVIAVEAKMGRVLWQKEMSSYRDMAIGSKAIYVTDAKGTLWAIDKSSGRTYWKQDILANRTLSAPTLLAGQILVGDAAGYVHVFNAEEGKLLARTSIGSAAIANPIIVSDNQAYIYDQAGQLRALHLESVV